MFGEGDSKQQTHVLYVDDETGFLELGKAFLESTSGFKVDIMEDAKEALNRLLTERYDAIVSDYQMPDMDGISFLKELRRRNNRTPFIIFTGKGREDVAIDALNSGADFYLQKGGNPSAQFAELSNMIKQSVCKRKNEIQLHRTKQSLMAITDNMIDCMMVTDENGFTLTLNKSTMKAMRGDREEKLIGVNIFDYVLEGDRGRIMEDFKRTLRGEGNETKPFRIRALDGSTHWMEGVSTRIRFEGRDAVMVIFRDVSRRITAEDRLRLSEERYASIVESQSDLICRFLPDMDVTFMNRSFVSIIEPLIGREVRNLWDVIPPFEHKNIRLLLQGISAQDRVGEYDHPFPLSDGRTGRMEWNIQGLFDMDDRIVEYQAVGRTRE